MLFVYEVYLRFCRISTISTMAPDIPNVAIVSPFSTIPQNAVGSDLGLYVGLSTVDDLRPA